MRESDQHEVGLDPGLVADNRPGEQGGVAASPDHIGIRRVSRRPERARISRTAPTAPQ